MPLELVLSLSSGLVSGVGVWFWAQHHQHPDLIHRNELELLRSLMTTQHESVLRELTQLRETLDRNSRR